MKFKWLKKINLEEADEFGGKAANLGNLFSKFNIPKGFCISFNSNMSKNKINELCKELKGPFAIRSSADIEDSKEYSFAGLFDSYLNVKLENVFDNIIKCKNSVNNQRLKKYLENKSLNPKVSVIVQEMINPKYAGVMFTLDPIHKKYLLIESVKGLGEKLVSGEVTPNTYFLDRDDYLISDKNLVFEMDEIIIKKIAKIGKEIELYYNQPMDIEWVIDKNDILYIVQSRPITTL